jgi:hypothetical protein
MSKAKAWPLGVLLTATTSKVMSDWGDYQEFATWLLERPIWTHHYPGLWGQIAEAVTSQLPQLKEWDGAHITPENVFDKLAKLEAKYGKELTLEPRPFKGEWSVYDGLSPDTEVIEVRL